MGTGCRLVCKWQRISIVCTLSAHVLCSAIGGYQLAQRTLRMEAGFSRAPQSELKDLSMMIYGLSLAKSPVGQQRVL